MVATRTPDASKRSRRRWKTPCRRTASTTRAASSEGSPRTSRRPSRIAGCVATRNPSGSPSSSCFGMHAPVCVSEGGCSGSAGPLGKPPAAWMLRPRPWARRMPAWCAPSVDGGPGELPASTSAPGSAPRSNASGARGAPNGRQRRHDGGSAHAGVGMEVGMNMGMDVGMDVGTRVPCASPPTRPAVGWGKAPVARRYSSQSSTRVRPPHASIRTKRPWSGCEELAVRVSRTMGASPPSRRSPKRPAPAPRGPAVAPPRSARAASAATGSAPRSSVQSQQEAWMSMSRTATPWSRASRRICAGA